MKYYYIEPEVAGSLGENTVIHREVHPPRVSKLHYRFDGWLGDVLLESFPSFIVAEDVEKKLHSTVSDWTCVLANPLSRFLTTLV
ncbi:MAG TPA: hypothetical protein VKC60_14085 [Opitutaceae bacterium]|nr:hypothetical protein [Opitutaceae bacterium]